ncbi:TIR domain-containing protein [candidate division KSB1 bacterium]
MKKPRIFLSYSYEDKKKAHEIAKVLEEHNVHVSIDEFTFNSDETLQYSFFKSLDSSDIFLLLLSRRTVKSRWIAQELNNVITKSLQYRDITIIPIVTTSVRIPNSLREKISFDLRRGLSGQLEKLANYLKLIPYIDFSILDGSLFESMCIELLGKLGFREATYDLYKYHKQDILEDLHRFDFVAQYKHKDPFGGFIAENWIFEFKYYLNSRADIHALRQVSSYLEGLSLNYTGCLITNGILTSAAQEWLIENAKRKRTNIRVIDGLRLKELLLKYPRIIEKYLKGGIENE